MTMLTCNVCDKNEAVGVFASSCGAVSFAYCQDCLDAGREPYGALAAHLMGASGMEDVAEWAKPIVRATLKAEGKTEEEFFQATAAMLWGIGKGIEGEAL